MNAAGQVLIEFVLLMAVVVLLLVGVIRKIPVTFGQSSPFLGAKLEQRLETGRGFAPGGTWQPPQRPDGKGGAK